MKNRLEERREQLARASLYAIVDTGYVAPDHLGRMTEKLVQAGVDLIQLRAKGQPLSEIVRMGQLMRELIPATGPLFILNDHPGLVGDIGADGTHVGQDDLSVSTAREQAGDGVLIGKSTHSLEQAMEAEQECPDYIGVGPIFATPTKPDYVPVGLELIRQVREKVRLPQFCIGGINAETLPAVLAAGGQRIVMVSALLKSDDIPSYCARIRTQLKAAMA